MATYRTPGVFVEEVSLFPPSVAEVETAIPAFIGHTEYAMEFQNDDLKEKPKMVKSLLDYEVYFGKGPSAKVEEVLLDENNNVTSKKILSQFYMYDSLRMYFDNGGGKCYIISIGSYNEPIELERFEKGLSALKKEDEPTIILFPDAVKMENANIYKLQAKALQQCADLQDRVAIFDLLESKSNDQTFTWAKGIEEFRENIGMNHLKYGAAYTPWIKASLGINIRYSDLYPAGAATPVVKRGGAEVKLSAMTNDIYTKNRVTDMDNFLIIQKTIKDDINTLKGDTDSIKSKYQELLDAFKNGSDNIGQFSALLTINYEIAKKVEAWFDLSSTKAALTNVAASNGKEEIRSNVARLESDIANKIVSPLKAIMAKMIAYDLGASNDAALTDYEVLYTDYETLDSASWGGIFDDATKTPVTDGSIFTGTTVKEKLVAAEPKITALFEQVYTVIAQIKGATELYIQNLEKDLKVLIPAFNNIIKTLNDSLTAMPSTGAVAGIYAMVDKTRGVWKAPANVSITGAIAPTVILDNTDQDTLNIDTVAGKSINAIRKFTGKGTLVWGARTLMGNDNEWRYISVRRFFNMVEESIKKSTYWAVFEPNDANTWIKVKAMIDNYLTIKWREGALQGAKSNEAFFVNVGLGTTMTAIDILEGRMIVEIGMAVVRPAEFIILKFSHKMPVS
jgi:phage tail sheath protein FI